VFASPGSWGSSPVRGVRVDTGVGGGGGGGWSPIGLERRLQDMMLEIDVGSMLPPHPNLVAFYGEGLGAKLQG
jgi:hypothetical protein